MRIAMFGGSFDPPHVGHLLAMAWVLGTARIDRLLMVPVFRHPFDKPLSAFEHRLEMARLTAEVLGGRVEVSDIERRLGGDSLTLRTVKALAAERPGAEIVLVVGADLLRERERWHGYEELRGLVEFLVVGRAGYRADEAPVVEMPQVSSTEIRERAAAGRPIDGLVVAAVAEYIAARGLYREGA